MRLLPLVLLYSCIIFLPIRQKAEGNYASSNSYKISIDIIT